MEFGLERVGLVNKLTSLAQIIVSFKISINSLPDSTEISARNSATKKINYPNLKKKLPQNAMKSKQTMN